MVALNSLVRYSLGQKCGWWSGVVHGSYRGRERGTLPCPALPKLMCQHLLVPRAVPGQGFGFPCSPRHRGMLFGVSGPIVAIMIK